MAVSVSKWGNSLGVRIPRDVASQVGLREGSRVDVRADDGKIVISPRLRRYKLEELLVNMTPEAMREAFDWGPDMGREIVDD
jgi:antitoxin MazE